MHVNPRLLLDIARRRRCWLIWPTVAGTVLALVYACITPRFWSATQALYIRDEGNGASDRLGRFESVDAMQTAQETILQVAQHQSVLEAALEEVGPRRPLRGARQAAWPSPRAVEGFRRQVYVKAPSGAQFGRTEMIYLTVKAHTPARAVALTRAVTANLIARMQKLRQEKYDGIVAELQQTVKVARDDLTSASRSLHDLETKVGVDLGQLRVLNNEGQGDTHLQRSATEITNELRRTENLRVSKEKELELLRAARQDPRSLIAMPSSALDGQPLLKRLKEGLVETQLEVSRKLGELNAAHPRAKAALEAERAVRQQLYEELSMAIEAVRSKIAILDSQVDALRRSARSTDSRLVNLADLRTQYDAASAEFDQRTLLLEAAEADLARARANALSATVSSLIQRVENPVPSSHAVGPGRKTIVLAGMLLGLVGGVGVIFLIEPATSGEQRRWSDHLLFGRRAGDVPAQLTQQSALPDRRRVAGGGRRHADLIGPAPGERLPIRDAGGQLTAMTSYGVSPERAGFSTAPPEGSPSDD